MKVLEEDNQEILDKMMPSRFNYFWTSLIGPLLSGPALLSPRQNKYN